MPDESGDELKSAWQSQPAETHVMTAKLIESKARELRAKTRRQLLGTLAGPLATAFFYVFAMKTMPPLHPAIHLLFPLALAWSLAGVYFLHRGMWSMAMPGDAGLSTGLEFCRREIERRERLLRGVLVWSFGPILLAIGIFILALATIGTRDRGILPNGLPFLFVVMAWIVGYFVMRVREQRALQREIELLNEVERETSGQGPDADAS